MPQVDSTQSFDVRRVLGALRRRKALIAGIIILITGIAFLRINAIVPLYVAEADVVVEGASNNVAPIEAVAQGITPDYFTNETEAEVISSRGMAEKVVARLDLDKSAVFNPLMQPAQPSLLDTVKSRVKTWLGLPDDTPKPGEIVDPWEGMSDSDRQAAQKEYYIDAYLGGLTAIPSQRARLITIQFVSTDPDIAAKAANMAADVYIGDQVASKGDATARASEWLNQRVVELRKRVIESEQKLEEFKRASGIVEIRGINTLQEQHGRLSGDLIEARTRRAEAQARYDQMRRLVSAEGGAESAAAVLDSPLVQRLREQEVVLSRKIAELKSQLRDSHPKLILAKEEFADLQKRLKSEVDKIVINLRNELQVARVREANLRRELTAIERQLDTQNDASVTLRALTSEVQANKQLYETVLARFKETRVVDEDIQEADAKIITRATVPFAPFYPRKNAMLMAALLISTVIAIAIALLLEFLDNGFSSVTQLEDVTGLPTITAIPRLGRADRRLLPHQVALRKPNSPYGEAIRSLRTGLMLSGNDGDPKVVMVTSSVSSEGKTSTALSLAILAAKSGQRAVILDCDIRHPSLHGALDVDNDLGLSNYLSGHAELDDVLEIDENSGLNYIVAGMRAPHPADLLSSTKMRALLTSLSHSYDLVVLDTPPILAVSDSLVLARHVDKTVFLVRWEKTPRDTAIAGVKQVIEAGTDLAGLVLTQVDRKKQARYGHSDSSYYYHDRHSKYYTD